MNGNGREESESYLVLSIDGGGFKGLASLLMLAHLMIEISGGDDTDVPRPCQIFDLICGTSAGGLIAILLGRLGLSCEEAIEVYREVGATMFGGERDPCKIWGHLMEVGLLPSAMFERKLEDLIAKYTGSKDTLFMPLVNAPDMVVHDSTKTFVAVVSTIGSAGVDPYRIRSYPRPLTDIDPAPYGHKWTIFEGARGTCANPIFLSPLKIQCDHATFMFQDAGYSGFNNPARVALDEAKSLFGSDANITIVSVGTGLRSLINVGGNQIHIDAFTQQILAEVGMPGENMQNATMVAKLLAKQYLDVATDTETSHLRMHGLFSTRGQQHKYHRFNPPQGLGDIQLTDYTQEAAISSITDAWLKSPAGRDAISSAVNNLKNRWSLKPKCENKAQP